MALYTCRCGNEFSARDADRKRGWGRYCSKSCKAIAQESRTGQYKAMTKDRMHDQAMSDNENGWDGHKNSF